ncbi:MAG: NADH-quinone oxidoreductase subunit L [Anaerolineae bacterium]|nr:NADH-quinone oxidoreductase subunit L [Anaerolineae bacterium]NUQ04041.1 NADH-quinone oxidoreductase subunit L [Anaerolineae bacterium]
MPVHPVILVILLPLLGMLANLFLAHRLREPTPGLIAGAAAGSAFLAALWAAGMVGAASGGVVHVHLFDWIAVGALQVPWALRLDALSAAMMVMITGVGTLIHVYAVGYMRGDSRYARFFVYLNLFLAAMLLLVSADNYLVLFVGWEGVGVCSYLLIGFWFDKPHGQGVKNSTAGRKAFIVNRIGDAGLLIGFGLLFWHFDSLQFDAVFAGASLLPAGDPLLVAVTICLLAGALGKSAQIPLFVWLPEAMAGPTPVSALIHAATMVTAGVFLILRSEALFALAPVTGTLIVAIGALTALLGASAAVAQRDIKRTLAYSTISQLGFMMAAVGMGAYTAALFHLITHACFKALLFLSAGSVVHALEHAAHHAADHAGRGGEPFPQDMRQMGGLRKRMPLTFWTYTLGALTLAGAAPLAGFFSKDAILGWAADHNPAAFLALAAAAGLTAFYVGRQWVMVFFGAPRTPMAKTAVESPPIMTRPLLLLAGLCLVGGALNLPGRGALTGWLGAEEESFHLSVAIASLALAAGGMGLAILIYGRAVRRAANAAWRDPLEARAERLMQVMRQGWWIDKLYRRTFICAFKRTGLALKAAEETELVFDRLTYAGYNRLTEALADADETLFEGLEHSTGSFVQGLAGASERTQTGQLNWNVVGIIGGLIVVFAIVATIGALR